jgi:hypothetical protein
LRSLATAKLEKDDCPKKWPCSVWPSWSSMHCYHLVAHNQS